MELKSRYRVRKNPPVVFTLSQINPVYTLLSYLWEISFNIILSTSGSFKWPLSFGCTQQNIKHFFPQLVPHLIVLVLVTLLFISWTSCLCSFIGLRSVGPAEAELFLKAPNSGRPWAYVSLIVRDQVSHSLINSHDHIFLYLNIANEKGEILDRMFAGISTVFFSRLPFHLLLSFPEVCTLPDFRIIFILWFRAALFDRDMSCTSLSRYLLIDKLS